MTNIGVVGLGNIGLGMAQALRRAGFDVHVCDIRPDVARTFAAEGGVPCTSPADVASRCEVVVSVVVNAKQTEQVLFGDEGAVHALRPGSLFIMCSTVDPDWSTKIEDRLADHGLLYLEAPVSGGDVLAAKGELTFITAGKPEAHKLAGEALKAMSANVYHVGDRAGAACSVKIINQLLVATHMAAAAEAVALGIRQGIDPGMLYDVITHSVGNSRMFEMRVPQIVKGDYSASAALDILVKDLGLVLDAARASNFPLPLASTVHQMFLQATAAGHGGEASAAVIKIFPGIRLPRT